MWSILETFGARLSDPCLRSDDLLAGTMGDRPKSITELRAMSKAKLSSMSKNDIMEVILTDKSDTPKDTEVQSTLDKILSEITLIKTGQETINKAIEEIPKLQKQVNELRDLVNGQSAVIDQQQRFIEQLDNTSRECNLVVTGVPEDSQFLQSDGDQGKIQALAAELDIADIGSYKVFRLGSKHKDRMRPLLLKLSSPELRNRFLTNRSKLKDQDATKKVFVKKDTHPAVRNEWRRLREREKTLQAEEQAKAPQDRHKIELDPKKRAILRDSEVVDSWKPSYF